MFWFCLKERSPAVQEVQDGFLSFIEGTVCISVGESEEEGPAGADLMEHLKKNFSDFTGYTKLKGIKPRQMPVYIIKFKAFRWVRTTSVC